MFPFNRLRAKFNHWVRRIVIAEIAQENIPGIREELREAREHSSLEDWREFVHKYLSDASAHLTRLDEGTQRVSAQTEINSLVQRDLRSELDQLGSDLRSLQSRIRALPFQAGSLTRTGTYDDRETLGFEESQSSGYVDFVDLFRPSYEALVQQHSTLTRLMPSSGIAVDLGAGRGEMVEALNRHGLTSFGIDQDETVVEAARARGLDVRQSGIEEFLRTSESDSIDVLTAIQVVEHVDTPVLEMWLELVKRTLRTGGVLVIETPNPHAVDAFKAFWLDVTHVRIYYPESLLHLVQKAGFSNAEIVVRGTQMSVYDRLEYAGSYALVAKV